MSAPAGWKLVPVIADAAMAEAGNERAAPYMVDARNLWAVMIAAAPEPPADQRDAEIAELKAAYRGLDAYKRALSTENARLREALAGMVAIADDSQGVAGYHMNGDIAEWDEFDALDLAQAALAPPEVAHD